MAKISINLKEGKVKKHSDAIIGIDLGTTNSLVAYINDGMPTAVQGGKEKRAIVPSIVHFDEKNKVVVGDIAREKLLTHPERTIYSVKRLMGKSFGDLENQEGFLVIKS